MRRRKKEFLLRYLEQNARGLPGAGALWTPPPRGRLSFSWCMGARLVLECVLLLERVLLLECVLVLEWVLSLECVLLLRFTWCIGNSIKALKLNLKTQTSKSKP
jgi:hypothetical protein